MTLAMKNPFIRLTRLAVFAAVSVTMASSALAGQPHMDAALNSLLAARAELQQAAAGRFAGERVAAINAIDRAIAQIRAGENFARKH